LHYITRFINKKYGAKWTEKSLIYQSIIDDYASPDYWRFSFYPLVLCIKSNPAIIGQLFLYEAWMPEIRATIMPIPRRYPYKHFDRFNLENFDNTLLVLGWISDWKKKRLEHLKNVECLRIPNKLAFDQRS